MTSTDAMDMSPMMPTIARANTPMWAQSSLIENCMASPAPPGARGFGPGGRPVSDYSHLIEKGMDTMTLTGRPCMVNG